MPAWALFVLEKLVLPIVIAWLQKEGWTGAAEAIALKTGEELYNEVKDLKEYDGPDDFPDAPPGFVATTNIDKS